VEFWKPQNFTRDPTILLCAGSAAVDHVLACARSQCAAADNVSATGRLSLHVLVRPCLQLSNTGDPLLQMSMFVLDRVASFFLPNWLYTAHTRNMP
jgi:hypothetical protein